MRPYRFLPILLLFSSPLIAQKQEDYSYQILFTGRTLGYARVPDEQTLVAPTRPQPANGFAQAFIDQFNKVTTDSKLQLRIGMGDNLAPDLFARTFNIHGVTVPSCDSDTAPYSQSIHMPKSFFNYEAGHWTIWCNEDPHYFTPTPFYDNVAEFFIRAHYDVVVPGKHDFYFGAQYLRKVAGLLQTNHVSMLAGNLIMNTSVAPATMNAHPSIPERFERDCHDNTGPHPCYHTDFGPASLDLPDNVLPWKRQFVLHGARRLFVHIAGEQGSKMFRSDLTKSYARSAAGYGRIFDENRTQICASPGSDPAMVSIALAANKCFDLIPSDEACLAPLPHLLSTCKALYKSDGIYRPDKNPATADVTFLFKHPGDHLIAGLNHMFCTYPATAPEGEPSLFDGSSKPICQAFPVQVPLFWSNPDEDKPDPGSASCEESSTVPCPYKLVKRNIGGTVREVAVFGVVDPDLLTNVGTLNTSWLNRTSKWDTKTQVTAPDYALRQALEFCNANEECRQAPKVLLAQMSYARGSQLIATDDFATTFGVVITQASPEHDTGELETRFTGDKPRFVLTPPMPTGKFSPDPLPTNASGPNSEPVSYPTFTPQVYVAEVSKTVPPDGTPLKTPPVWSLSNSVPAGPQAIRAHDLAQIPVGAKPVNLERLSKLWLTARHAAGSAQLFPVTTPGPSNAFQQAALLAMRTRAKADIAILQTRDLYDADNLSFEPIPPYLAQDQISRILWKDDFMVVLHVTGATIRKLMTQSAAFAQQDANALSTEIETGRSLITLGIYPNPKDSDVIYVNGAVMSDTALYTIATTDFIVGGDTGYSILAAPDVPPALRAKDFAQRKVMPIAGLVCSEIAPTSGCANMELGPDYLDRTTQTPFDATPGFSTAQHWRGFLRNFAEPRRPFPELEQKAQQRAFWSLNLENFDFSESGLFINHLATAKASLGGISNPLITQTGSSNIGADHKARFVYDFRQGTFYLLSDSAYLRNATTPNGLSLASNVLGTEAGGTWRLPMRRPSLGLKHVPDPWQRPSWLSFQYSVRYERELTHPLDTAETLNGGLSALLPMPKISTLYGKLGLRAEIGDTYLETGVEEIDSLGLLQQYQIIQSGATLYCQPAPSSLNCGPDKTLNTPSDVTPILQETSLGTALFTSSLTTTSYRVPGAYLNFFWKFPIWSRRDANRTDQSWYFTLTNKGDIYFNKQGDTAVQTRYLDKLTPALSFPIWGNISLTPKVDFILYENKVNRYHYRSIAPSISLSYTFNLRQGMGWTRALAYGAQSTVASPAGNTH